jgi:hypothetical protein
MEFHVDHRLADDQNQEGKCVAAEGHHSWAIYSETRQPDRTGGSRARSHQLSVRNGLAGRPALFIRFGIAVLVKA